MKLYRAILTWVMQPLKSTTPCWSADGEVGFGEGATYHGDEGYVLADDGGEAESGTDYQEGTEEGGEGAVGGDGRRQETRFYDFLHPADAEHHEDEAENLEKGAFGGWLKWANLPLGGCSR